MENRMSEYYETMQKGLDHNVVLTRAKEVVGWLSQNLWALLVGNGGLLYTYLVTRR